MKDDVAAKPGFSVHQRRRQQASRLIHYALIQALIVIACVFVLRQPPAEPSAQYLVTAFSLKEGGAEHPVTLPHFTASRFS